MNSERGKTGVGLDELGRTFRGAGLAVPPIPARFGPDLRLIEPWCFGTRLVDPMEMYFFDEYIDEVLTRETSDYVAVSHAGHGANSYSINYHLVDGPLAVFVQVGWGGVYNDRVASAKDVKEMFGRIATLLSANDRAKARGLTERSGRLVVIESDFREQFLLGWLAGPLRGEALPTWRNEHGQEVSGTATLPTVAAVAMLDRAGDRA